MPVSDCKDIPKGAVPSSAGMTLATLELERGFYRTSSESHEVLECHRKDSCIGGLNASNYCAAGYEGPCKSNNEPPFRKSPVFIYANADLFRSLLW